VAGPENLFRDVVSLPPGHTDEETTETEDTETTDTTETSASDDFATAENCEEFAQIGAQVSEAGTGTAGAD